MFGHLACEGVKEGVECSLRLVLVVDARAHVPLALALVAFPTGGEGDDERIELKTKDGVGKLRWRVSIPGPLG